MKTCIVLTCGLVLTALVAGAIAEEPQHEEPGSFWMKKKVEYSERILEGLAKEDYEEIAKSARSMSALTQLEKWVRASVPAYRSQLRIFENANDQLIRTAEAEQLDGAALAYVQLTLSCVNCHKVVRDNPAEAAPRKP